MAAESGLNIELLWGSSLMITECGMPNAECRIESGLVDAPDDCVHIPLQEEGRGIEETECVRGIGVAEITAQDQIIHTLQAIPERCSRNGPCLAGRAS